MLHTKFQLNIPSHYGEKVGFISFANFRISGYLRFLTWLNFIGLKPCCLVMLHVKFENQGEVISENQSSAWI